MCSEALRDSYYFLISHMDWSVSLISEAINLTIVVQESLVFFSEWSIVFCITCIRSWSRAVWLMCWFCVFLQFSKEKYLLESPPEKLRKELEEELKLCSSDMRSHGWYHGHIPREVRLWVKVCWGTVCSLSHPVRILTKRNRVWFTLQPILDL